MTAIGKWEERWHPLREEWVIVAAHRQNRPWIGGTLAATEQSIPDYDPTCYLCPGNPRVSGKQNPAYTGVYVFDNDHPCVGDQAPTDLPQPTGIYRSRPANGIARVVCYNPKHNITLAESTPQEVQNLVATWQQQYTDLGNHREVNHVLVFENKGEAVGVSNPHPHCQIYATNFVFKTIETEVRATQRHRNETGRVLFQDIIAAEQADARRIICENEHAIACAAA